MTTSDIGASGSQEGSGERATAAAKEGRQEERRARRARQDGESSGRALRSVTASLLELRQEMLAQREQAERGITAASEATHAGVAAAEAAYVRAEGKLGRAANELSGQISLLGGELGKLAGYEQRQGQRFMLAAILSALVFGWAGWAIKGWRDGVATDERERSLSQLQLFGAYLLEVHPKEAQHYWKSFQAWDAKRKP